MKFYVTQSDKQFLLAFIGALGIIMVWRGIWGIVDETPILNNFWVSLFIGMLIITFSGLIYTQFSAGAVQDSITFLSKIYNYDRDELKKFYIYYKDKKTKRIHNINAWVIDHIEPTFLSLFEKNREIFVPAARIVEIKRGSSVVWKK